MAMRITERLKAEHGVFLFQLDHLRRLVESRAPLETLRAVVDAIASAEMHHSEIEDRLLYPLLARAAGVEPPLLQRSREEHEEVRRLVVQIQAGFFDEVTVVAFLERLRSHLEHEIHDLFALADELIPPEHLVSLSNWDVEHLYEANGRRPWVERPVI
jgi:hemerythrin-like domain-containing protein